jgi:hypothetical protein
MRRLIPFVLLVGCVLPTSEAGVGHRAPARAAERADLGNPARNVHDRANGARRATAEAPLRGAAAPTRIARAHRRDLLDRVSATHGTGGAVDRDDRVFVTQVLC